MDTYIDHLSVKHRISESSKSHILNSLLAVIFIIHSMIGIDYTASSYFNSIKFFSQEWDYPPTLFCLSTIIYIVFLADQFLSSFAQLLHLVQ